MKIPKLDIGHINSLEGKDILVKNVVYKNDGQLESSFPHKHNFYMICLIRNGSGVHVVDFKEIDVLPNRLFIISPSQVHFWKLSTDTNISLVQFSESVLHFDNLPGGDCLCNASMFRKSYIDLDKKQAIDIIELFLKLEKEAAVKGLFSLDIVRGYLIVLSGLIGRIINNSIKPGKFNQKENKLHDYITLVDIHFAKQKNVNYYANELNITANYLNMLAKQLMGINAGEIISRRIILEAKRMLYHTSLDISQIAFNLGYDDPSYFTRFFKKSENNTPSAFREHIYKKYQHVNN